MGIQKTSELLDTPIAFCIRGFLGSYEWMQAGENNGQVQIRIGVKPFERSPRYLSSCPPNEKVHRHSLKEHGVILVNACNAAPSKSSIRLDPFTWADLTPEAALRVVLCRGGTLLATGSIKLFLDQGLRQGLVPILLLPPVLPDDSSSEYASQRDLEALSLPDLSEWLCKRALPALVLKFPTFNPRLATIPYEPFYYKRHLGAPTSNDQQQEVFVSIKRILEKPVTWLHTLNERKLLWRCKRAALHCFPRTASTKLLQCLDWDDREDVDELLGHLANLGDSNVDDLMQLLAVLECAISRGDRVDKRCAQLVGRALQSIAEGNSAIMHAPELLLLSIPRPAQVEWLSNMVREWLLERAQRDRSLLLRLAWLCLSFIKEDAPFASKQSEDESNPEDDVYLVCNERDPFGIFLRRQVLPRMKAPVLHLFARQVGLFRRLKHAIAVASTTASTSYTSNKRMIMLESLNVSMQGIRFESDADLYLPFDFECVERVLAVDPSQTLVYKSRAVPVKVAFNTAGLDGILQTNAMIIKVSLHTPITLFRTEMI